MKGYITRLYSFFICGTLDFNPFWNWFLQNHTRLEQFIDSSTRNYTIYNKMNDKMKEVNELIHGEITKSKEGKYILVISADGQPEGFDAVQELYDCRPQQENWEIIKFRQPQDKITFTKNDVSFPQSDVEVVYKLADSGEQFDIVLFVRNLNTDLVNYRSLAYLYLDHIIGEYNSIKKINYIDVKHLGDDKTVENSITLDDLRNRIEEELYLSEPTHNRLP